jgi:DNA-binding transcriptional MerR regulator
MTSQFPIYNLKAVLKETGLKADVLRAWERRYELPKPQRSPGGHRLYSEYDIETLKWLRARQSEGLSISRAVELWKEIIEAGLDPLLEYLPAGTAPAPDRLPVADARIEILRQRWLEANLAFDSLRVDEVLNQAFAIYPVETVCTEILQQGLSDIGNYWYLDQASAQQEHFASALASRRLETLISATPPPTRPQTILVGCPPGEWHTFSVLLLSLFLCRRSLKVVYLGADIPIERLEETSHAINPDLIILAAQQLSTAATLQSAALVFQGQGVPLAYGGLIFNRVPKLREYIPAHFLGEALYEAIPLVERLVVAPTAFSTAVSVSDAYWALAMQYREKRSRIEIAVFEELQKSDLQTEYLGEANSFFGNGLSAALGLGDPAFLEADLEWLKEFLIGRQIPSEHFIPYLAAYSDAIREEMGEASAPITDWINSYIAQNGAAHYMETNG